MLEPYTSHIIFKHWGFQHEDYNGVIHRLLPVNWMDLEPNKIIQQICYFINDCESKSIL